MSLARTPRKHHVARLPSTRFTVPVATCAGVRDGVAGGAFDVGLLLSHSPRLRYLIRPQAKSVARLRRFLRAGMFEQGVRRTFSLDKTQ